MGIIQRKEIKDDTRLYDNNDDTFCIGGNHRRLVRIKMKVKLVYMVILIGFVLWGYIGRPRAK